MEARSKEMKQQLLVQLSTSKSVIRAKNKQVSLLEKRLKENQMKMSTLSDLGESLDSDSAGYV